MEPVSRQAHLLQGRCASVTSLSAAFVQRKMKWEYEFCRGMISRLSSWLFGALLILLFSFVSPGWAQWASSGLTGTVSDSTGHGLPGVAITAVQDATGFQRAAVSSAEGAYYFPKLPVGTSAVPFDHHDFQSVRFATS